MEKVYPSLTSLFIPSSLSRKFSGAFAQNKDNSLKDHTSGLSESNFDHTHRQKAILMKQFTWQLMCKNFKKTLKINFLYLTRTLPRTSDMLHMFFTYVFRNSPHH